MDEIDMAQARDQEFRDTVLAAHKAKIITSPGSDTCLDCGDDIPEARRKAVPSAIRCAFCQSEGE